MNTHPTKLSSLRPLLPWLGPCRHQPLCLVLCHFSNGNWFFHCWKCCSCCWHAHCCLQIYSLSCMRNEDYDKKQLGQIRCMVQLQLKKCQGVVINPYLFLVTQPIMYTCGTISFLFLSSLREKSWLLGFMLILSSPSVIILVKQESSPKSVFWLEVTLLKWAWPSFSPSVRSLKL